MGLYDNVLLDHILFFLLAIVLPGMSLKRGEIKTEGNWSSIDKIIFYYTNGLILWLAAFVVLGLWIFTSRSLGDFGFQLPELNTIAVVLTIVFIGLYALEIFIEFGTSKGYERMLKKWRDETNFMPSRPSEYKHYAFLSFTAGITEEIVFRGFLMNYIFSMGHNENAITIAGAIVIPALIFGFIHMYQGKKAVLKIMIGSLFFGSIYYYTRSLLLVILIHTIIDLFTGYLIMRALVKDASKVPLDPVETD